MPDADINKIENETRLELLYEIGRVLASSETLDDAAPQILEAICRRLDFQLGELWFVDETKGHLRLRSVWHLPSAEIEQFVARSRKFEFPAGEGLPGKVWARNAPVWIQDINAEKHLPRKAFIEEIKMRSGFAFPILLGEKFLGVFGFFCREACAVDDALMEMFAAVGSHVGQFVKRERTEANLRESDERYRAFIRQSTEGIWRFELDETFSVDLPVDEQVRLAFRDGYLAECNDAMARMYGFERAADLIGKRLGDLLDTSDAANVEYVRAFIESGYSLIDAQSHEKDASGKDVFFLNSLIGLVENNHLVRVWGTQRNITERKRAERAVLASEESYRIVAETASDAIIKINEQSEILFVNHAVERIFGYTVEEMVGQPLTMIMPEELRDAHRNGLRRYIETGRRRLAWEGIEIPARHKNGQTFPLEISFGEYNQNGERFFIGIARDITERKRTAEKILESETSMRLALGAARMYSWELDIETQTTSFGENFAQVVGLSQPIDRMKTAETYRKLIHPDDREKIERYIERAAVASGSHSIETRLVNPETGAIVWIEATGYTRRDAAGNPARIIGVAQNITDRKQAENRLALLAEISELSRSLEDPSELLFAVAQTVGRQLEVRRCLFNEIDIERDLEIVHRDYCHSGVSSVAGEHRISDYSSVTSADMLAGKTVVNRDSKIDARTAEDYKRAYEPNGERAYIAVPLLRENRWVASLWVSDDKPRDWSAQEISLLETVAERTWTAIEKLRINRALRLSEEHLKLAIDISRTSTFEIDLPTDAMETDAVGRQIYGFEIDEPLTFEKVQERFHPDDKPEVLRRVAAAFDPNGTHEFEVEQRIIRADGEVRWIRVLGRAFFDGEADERRAVRCLGTYVDITASKRDEEKLRESSAILETINRNSPTLIYLKDRAGRMLDANASTLAVLGKSLAELVGKTHGEYSGNAEEGAILAENDRRIIEGGATETFEEIVLMNGEPHTFLSIKTPYRNAAGETIGLVGVSFDITERKRAEIERERLLTETEQARRAAEQANHAKDEFIALVSHELRSPLNAMLGWTRILQEQKSDAQTLEYALDVIVRNARAQSKLIEDLLDIARIGEKKLRLDMQPTELVPIIQTAVEFIEPTAAAKNIVVAQTLDRAANFIVGDDDRLRQVVDNLLSNAVKFTPNGGRVEVNLRRVGDCAKIVVSDNGQGISAEFLPQIFERFKQADLSTTRRHGGLGIGLSLAQDLVELHGGAITASSKGDGKGATFTVSLPIRTIVPIKENTIKVEAMDGQGKLSGFWILAVDDEADAREIVSFMLQINGARVTTANSAVEALDILKNSDGRLPDILLSDISMPNESGYALLEKIRALPQENGGQIPAVALTAFNRPEDRQSAYEAGFQKHLGKPVEMEDLISAIIETAGKG